MRYYFQSQIDDLLIDIDFISSIY